MSYGQQAGERLADKVVLLTGASAGIGYATAKELAQVTSKVKLILTARRKEKLDQLAKVLTSEHSGIRIHVAELDVSNLDSFEPFLKGLPEEFADIDVLINNAGLALGRESVGEIDRKDMITMFQTNVFGTIELTQQVLPIMKKKNSGTILNLGSIAGKDYYAQGSIYCQTKSSIHVFSDVLRKELISTRIRVMEVQPGNVRTEFSNVRYRGDAQKADDVYKGTEPLTADDVAELIVFNLTRRENTVIAESLIFANNQASSHHIYRKE
ncbi:unnamed protein product [Candida verbasci]|uniref:Uncharacterized protein n=1 Tax=Candida verbasci TaxID=1227364 RepID=A0A9W4XBB4_9ASCO|nr:unnamed protein product [Candida verbasci]